MGVCNGVAQPGGAHRVEGGPASSRRVTCWD